jgi:lipopolysaccharide biosynthesis glycosyltransferase
MEINLKQKQKIFIGSGEASLIEKKVCIYSLRKNCNLTNLEIFCFNGTHDTLENESGDVIKKINLDIHIKYENNTEFTFYKFLVPDLCDHEGNALFIDSDILCLGDLNELYQINLKENAVLAKKSAYLKDEWGTSVMMFNCNKYNLNLRECFNDIKNKKYSKEDLLMFTKQFRDFHNINIQPYDDKWNSFDFYDENTRLLHYTNLHHQPWKFHGNQYGKIWFKYFFECVKQNIITKEDIQKSIDRSYIRSDIMDGNDLKLSKFLMNNLRYFKNVIRNLLKGK